jgi:hypothetical protein
MKLFLKVLTSAQGEKIETEILSGGRNDTWRGGCCLLCFFLHFCYCRRWLEKDSEEFKSIRTRALPDCVTGQIRIMSIEGVDNNTCCGTHVKTTSHLEMVKLLEAETIKGQTRVWFVAGGRVTKALGQTWAAQKRMTGLLKCAPDEHHGRVDAVLKWQKVRALLIDRFLSPPPPQTQPFCRNYTQFGPPTNKSFLDARWRRSCFQMPTFHSVFKCQKRVFKRQSWTGLCVQMVAWWWVVIIFFVMLVYVTMAGCLFAFLFPFPS